MHITILTLFPNMINGFLQDSIIKRAVEKGAATIDVVNIRDYAIDTHKTVDDRPYGGGAGMVLKVDVLHQSLVTSRKSSVGIKASHTILTSAKGKPFNQKKAIELSKLQNITIICGHYEGVDERIMEFVDEEISLGDFVLTGGELAAATITDSIVRLLPGVLKKDDASTEESFWEVPIKELMQAVGNDAMLVELQQKGIAIVQLLEYPHYTRPSTFLGATVPEVLQNGNAAHIRKWRLQEAFKQTVEKRSDLLQ
jgi:tRNA (guanine37-N1)-methyltransferase